MRAVAPFGEIVTIGFFGGVWLAMLVVGFDLTGASALVKNLSGEGASPASYSAVWAGTGQSWPA